jgi:hypothetical protein
MFFITFLNERRDALKELVRCLYEWKVAHALQRKESENACVQSSAQRASAQSVRAARDRSLNKGCTPTARQQVA